MRPTNAGIIHFVRDIDVASSREHPDPLQPVLREAEAELTRRLQQACEAEAKGVANESAAEIRQLEDALLAAAVAAEHTLSLRKHIDGKREADHPAEPRRAADADIPAAPPRASGADSHTAPSRASGAEATLPAPKGAPCATAGSTTGTVREFTDRTGHAWRAWPVTPGQSRSGRMKHFLGDFQLGWICFEGVHDSARRRLPGHPPRWTELTEEELDALLQRAFAVKERRAPSADARASAPDR